MPRGYHAAETFGNEAFFAGDMELAAYGYGMAALGRRQHAEMFYNGQYDYGHLGALNHCMSMADNAAAAYTMGIGGEMAAFANNCFYIG